MKRSVAILGPTPSFVRWAIRFDCPLRQLESENLPDATFRQLRAIKELSIARNENREFQGIAVHAEHCADAESAMGFFTDEVEGFYGGRDNIQQNCGGCPANAVGLATEESSWAGCYGWFLSKYQDTDYVLRLNELAEQKNDSEIRWHNVWQVEIWNGSKLAWLEGLIATLLNDSDDTSLAELHAAIRTCIQHELTLETQLMPNGNSDGLNWTISAHCPECKFELAESAKVCGECGRQGAPIRASKRRVLGLRPYVRLQHLLGKANTEKFLALYDQQVSRDPA